MSTPIINKSFEIVWTSGLQSDVLLNNNSSEQFHLENGGGAVVNGCWYKPPLMGCYEWKVWLYPRCEVYPLDASRRLDCDGDLFVDRVLNDAVCLKIRTVRGWKSERLLISWLNNNQVGMTTSMTKKKVGTRAEKEGWGEEGEGAARRTKLWCAARSENTDSQRGNYSSFVYLN